MNANGLLRPLTVLTIAALVTATAACRRADVPPPGSSDAESGGTAAAPDDVSAPATLRGFATFGHEVRSFRPCGSDESFWAIDPSGLLWSLHQELAPHVQPYEEVFSVVRGRRLPSPAEGFGEDYPGAFAVEDVIYMASEGLGCEADWNAFQFRLFGNEPFWSMVIFADRIELLRLEETDLNWTPVRREQHEGTLRFTAERFDSQEVEVGVEHLPCRDSMSGAYFAFSAAVRFGRQELQGCALEGNASPGEWY